MNSRNISLVIIILMLIALAISFTRATFKSKKSRSSKGRIYTDYKPYKESSETTGSSKKYRRSRRNMYRSSEKAREIKEKMYANAGNITMKAYDSYMSQIPVSSEYKSQDKPLTNQYEEMNKFSRIPLAEYHLGLQLYALKDYDEAIRQFTTALEKIDKMDVLHAIDCYRMLAECYFRTKSEDGYIQNKIRQVRMERKKIKIIRDAYPQESFDSMIDWPSTAECMKQLLQARNAFNRGDKNVTSDNVRRAEYNLKVARQVSK